MKRVMVSNGAGFIMCHNHPSGNVHPSIEDDNATQRLHECGKLMDMQLVDHIIIGNANNEYYSYCANDWNDIGIV